MYTGQLSEEDEVLAARVAQGDETAFEILYDRHSSTALGLILRITGERATAEELLQETFWKVWKSAASYQPERGTFKSWLFKIARNLAIDEYRRRNVGSQMIYAEVNDADPVLDRVPDPDVNIPEQAQLNVLAGQVREAMKSLPQEQRQVIELAYFYGITRQEIADVTGEPIGTIHTRARLGLQKLRDLLEQE